MLVGKGSFGVMCQREAVRDKKECLAYNLKICKILNLKTPKYNYGGAMIKDMFGLDLEQSGEINKMRT